MSNFLTPLQVSTMINIKPQTLAVWRCRRKGPPYVNVGRVLYKLEDVLQWIDNNKVNL